MNSQIQTQTQPQAKPVAAPAPIPRAPGRVRRWIIDHDDSKLFLFAYVIFSIVLTIWIGLFWLLVMVGVHIVFECIKKAYDGARRPGRIVSWALWDTKLDLMLVIIAFVLLVFTSVTLGVAGVGSAGRLSLFGFRLTRFTSGARAIMPLPFKDVVLASRIACVRKLDQRDIKKRRQEFVIKAPTDRARARRIASREYPWQGKWTFADKLALTFIILNLGAVVAGFVLAQEPPMEVLSMIGEQLHPWPSKAPIE